MKQRLTKLLNIWEKRYKYKFEKVEKEDGYYEAGEVNALMQCIRELSCILQDKEFDMSCLDDCKFLNSVKHPNTDYTSYICYKLNNTIYDLAEPCEKYEKNGYIVGVTCGDDCKFLEKGPPHFCTKKNEQIYTLDSNCKEYEYEKK